jgi:hypothetical protein
MKTTFSILFFIFLGLSSVVGQILDKKYVDNWIINTFPNSIIDSSTIYIINGLPFDNKLVNKEFNKYKQNDLIVIDFIDRLLIDSLMLYPRSSIVLISTKQTRKTIKSDIAKAKQRFLKRDLKTSADIDTSLKEPVLIINGMQIFHSDCYTRINTIKISDIIGINLIERPVSKETYGSNAVNGLIMIKTKQ